MALTCSCCLRGAQRQALVVVRTAGSRLDSSAVRAFVARERGLLRLRRCLFLPKPTRCAWHGVAHRQAHMRGQWTKKATKQV